MPIHYLRRSTIAQQYRSDLAQQLSTVNQYCTGSEHVDEAWQNVKGAMLAAFSAVCPTSPIRPQDHWMSASPLMYLRTNLSACSSNAQLPISPPQIIGEQNCGSYDHYVRKTRTPRLAIEKLVEPEVKRNDRNKLVECLTDGTVSDINGHWEKISKALLKVEHLFADRVFAGDRRQIPPGRHHNSTRRIIRRQGLAKCDISIRIGKDKEVFANLHHLRRTHDVSFSVKCPVYNAVDEPSSEDAPRAIDMSYAPVALVPPSYCLQCIAPCSISPMKNPLTPLYLGITCIRYRLQCAATYPILPNRCSLLNISNEKSTDTPVFRHHLYSVPPPVRSYVPHPPKSLSDEEGGVDYQPFPTKAVKFGGHSDGPHKAVAKAARFPFQAEPDYGRLNMGDVKRVKIASGKLLNLPSRGASCQLDVQ
ncbi:hypothetical protein CLF_100693, partial [Clonorchis sinensis]